MARTLNFIPDRRRHRRQDHPRENGDAEVDSTDADVECRGRLCRWQTNIGLVSASNLIMKHAHGAMLRNFHAKKQVRGCQKSKVLCTREFAMEASKRAKGLLNTNDSDKLKANRK